MSFLCSFALRPPGRGETPKVALNGPRRYKLDEDTAHDWEALVASAP